MYGTGDALYESSTSVEITTYLAYDIEYIFSIK